MANICRSKNISSLHDALCSIFNLISFDACSYLAYRSSPHLPNCPLANRNIMTKINFTMKKYGNVIIAVGVPPRLEGRESEVIITGVETPFIFFLLYFDIQWKYSYWNEERIIFIHSQEMNKSIRYFKSQLFYLLVFAFMFLFILALYLSLSLSLKHSSGLSFVLELHISHLEELLT